MSRKHHECCSYKPCNYGGVGYGARGGSFGLVGIIILILIVLQFRKEGCHKDHKKEYDCDEHDREYDEYDEDDNKEYEEEYDEEYCEYEEEDHKESKRDEFPLIDNGILFIIALFYLSCCGNKWC